MTLRTTSQRHGKGDFSSVRFLSQVIEFTHFGGEHNIALTAPSEEAEQRREVIPAVPKLSHSNNTLWYLSDGTFRWDLTRTMLCNPLPKLLQPEEQPLPTRVLPQSPAP